MSLVDKADKEKGLEVEPEVEREEVEDELFGLTATSSKWEQLEVIGTQALPVTISFVLGIGGSVINMFFAGQYTNESGSQSAITAGVSLAMMFANVSCLSILYGMSGAVETLGSQHNGAGNYREVGLILQRSCLILGLITIPLVGLWSFSADIFASLGVEPEVCRVIQRYIRIRSFAVPIDVLNISYEKYLMSMGVVKPTMFAQITFNGLILSLDCLFVYGLKLPYESLAWSWVIANYMGSFMQFALSWSHPSVQRTLQPFDKEAWSNWSEFITLGLPGTVMLCSEWWAYEILTIFASLLGTAEVAAQTIMLQTVTLAFMISLGTGVTCASLVGNALGAGERLLAASIAKLTIGTIVCIELVIGTSLFVGGSVYVDLFSKDPEVIHVINRAIPFLALFTMVDGLQGVCSGVLRGAGKQTIGAVANIIAFYAIGLPMAWTLCFKTGLGVNGLMMGIACGTIFQATVLLTLIFGFEKYMFSGTIIREVKAESEPMMKSGAKDMKGDFQRLPELDDEESQHGIVLNQLSLTTQPA